MNNSLSILGIKEYIETQNQKKLSIEEIIDFLETAINISDFQFYHKKPEETSSKDIFEQFISQISKEEMLDIYNYINNETKENINLPKSKTLSKRIISKFKDHKY